ncbi:MAG: hypothetical protein ACTHW2_10310, partial [Tissierella sp.]|uniref:hypothetical protein n=1 Tax=Tissierella sp. TaxID=41274 RepID=UPI003F944C86
AYFILGGVQYISTFHIPYIRYVFSLFIQFLSILFLVKKGEGYNIRERIREISIINILIIIFINYSFWFYGTNIILTINRLITLFAIFGFLIIFYIDLIKYKDFQKILTNMIYGYTLIGVIIIIDALFFTVLKFNIWPPIEYLGTRFAGPFFDPNFLGLFYGVMLIIVLFKKDLEIKDRKWIIGVFIINIILSLSWTVIILFVFSLSMNKFIKFKNIFVKQLIFLGIYLGILFFAYINIDFLQQLFVDTLSLFLPFSEKELVIKFLSLKYRIVAQVRALSFVAKTWVGLGPNSIVPFLGRDTHNSYLGILFELGIPGFILLLINIWFNPKNYNKCLDILSTYIFLMSFTLNVHYTIIFTLFVSMLITNYYNENKKLYTT